MNRLQTLTSELARLRDDRAGATAIVTGLMSVTALGFVALGTDMGVAYSQKRSAQSAADSAAYSAAVAKAAGATNKEAQARAVAASYGFTDGAHGVQVTAVTPTSGPQAGNPNAVEVTVSQPMRRYFSNYFDKSPKVISARAVAVAGAAGNACIIALNATAPMSALNNGAGAVKLDKCAMYVNSTSPQGFTNNGSGSFSAESINLVAANYLNNGTGSVSQPVNLEQAAVADPYAGVAQPTKGACDLTNKTYIASETISPDADGMKVFCGNLTLSGIGKTYTFKPGLYIISGGDFRMSGANMAVTTEAGGATFFLTGTPYGKVIVNGTNVTLDLAAPSSGPLAGLLFFQDRGATAGVDNVFNGVGNTFRFQGALYFRTQKVTVNGWGQSAGNGCVQIVADQIAFNGGSTLGANCAGAGVRAVGGFKTALVE